MKNKKLFINILAIIILILIYFLAKYILDLKSMAFMSISVKMFNCIFIFLSLYLIVQNILKFYKILRNKSFNSSKRILSGFGGAIGVISLIILLIYASITIIFEIYPEYIVEKDGKKMVAYVDSFMEVNVNYYDYINPLIRGNNIKIHENYGNGGYDPFELDKMPAIKFYTYYDEDGKVIKSNYKEIKD